MAQEGPRDLPQAQCQSPWPDYWSNSPGSLRRRSLAKVPSLGTRVATVFPVFHLLCKSTFEMTQRSEGLPLDERCDAKNVVPLV